MSNNMKIMGRSRNNKFKTLVTSGKEGSMRLDGNQKENSNDISSSKKVSQKVANMYERKRQVK